MKRYALMVVDTGAIQDYIFGTNNLKQNAGASYLVDCATRKWVADALPKPNNVLDLDDMQSPFSNKNIEDGELKAEIVYTGGGNAIIIFAEPGEAVAFTKRYTRHLLLEASNLHILLAHTEFDWDEEPLGGDNGVVRRVMAILNRRKNDHVLSPSVPGLAVTAACTYTDLPAVTENIEDGETHLLSAEALTKVQAFNQAHGRLLRLVDWCGYQVPMNFDDFGRTVGESSYIAVIHTDGNGMSKRIRALRDKFPLAQQNRDYIREMRQFSLSLQNASMEALCKTVRHLANSVKPSETGEKCIGPVVIRDNKLPFRPLIFGGDDVTFVCDGRLGISLAACFLNEFSSRVLSDGMPPYARAGVAVVKTHYPFAQSYALAEALCASAKNYVLERQKPPFNEDGLTVMDWHFATGGVITSLERIREREYTVRDGKLFARPIRLTSQGRDWRSWDVFSQLVAGFQAEEFAARRNKVKALRDALRSGPDAVEHFCRIYGLRLPQVPGWPGMSSQGWQGGRCVYFDVIEALDFFVSIGGGKE
ncbi:MAG: hypothetical protein QXI12_07760 [Candidatus Methanomethyliaceae archaeon]